MSKLFRGTVAELAGRISINGRVLSAPELSMIVKLGEGSFARKVGVGPKPTRGVPANIWEIDASGAFAFKDATDDPTKAVA